MKVLEKRPRCFALVAPARHNRIQDTPRHTGEDRPSAERQARLSHTDIDPGDQHHAGDHEQREKIEGACQAPTLDEPGQDKDGKQFGSELR
jgi:hypothetical protein